MSILDLHAVLKELKFKPLDLIGHPEKIKRIRQQARLKCHPDKHTDDKPEEWKQLFNEINRIFNIIEDPQSAIEFSPFSLEHFYHSSTKEGDVTYKKTAKITYELDIPIISSQVSPYFLNMKLADERLNQLNQRFEKLMVDFIKKILEMKDKSVYESIFSSSKQLEFDLMFLINNQQSADFNNTINLLKSSYPKDKNFEEDRCRHDQYFIDFYKDYFNKNEFKANLLKIYLKMAAEEKVHWLCDKKTYAALIGWCLKAPAYTIYILIMAPLILIPILMLPILFSVPEIIVLTPLLYLALGWAAVAGIIKISAMYFNKSMFDILESIAVPFATYANFVDRIVNTLFNVKMHVTELAELLDKVEIDYSQSIKQEKSSQYVTKFGFYKPKHRSEGEVSVHEPSTEALLAGVD